MFDTLIFDPLMKHFQGPIPVVSSQTSVAHPRVKGFGDNRALILYGVMMLDVWNVGWPIAEKLEQYLALLCAGGVGMLHTNYAKGVLPSLQETVAPFLVTFLTIIKYQLCYLLSSSLWSCP